MCRVNTYIVHCSVSRYNAPQHSFSVSCVAASSNDAKGLVAVDLRRVYPPDKGWTFILTVK